MIFVQFVNLNMGHANFVSPTKFPAKFLAATMKANATSTAEII
jgi:hypothetical protein